MLDRTRLYCCPDIDGNKGTLPYRLSQELRAEQIYPSPFQNIDRKVLVNSAVDFLEDGKSRYCIAEARLNRRLEYSPERRHPSQALVAQIAPSPRQMGIHLFPRKASHRYRY